ncbi:hypothetical protein [Gemmobacter sp.]|uniref:hypothetical protein n=1 Tax=Gemmobacter sp. TaxID=1898957 RepID=UPI002AFE09F4|nr:hypothetical protein [Gemmobacter sp.]
MTILIENNRYRLTLARPEQPTGVTVLSWPYLRTECSPTRDTPFPGYEPQDFASRSGLNSLRVESTRNDWFQGAEIDDVLAAVTQFCRDSDVLISYGSSMGGHAAIALAPECKADFVLAVAPQASLAANFMRAIKDPRWADCVPHFRHDRILNGSCKQMRGLVIFDPHNPRDTAHAQAIQQHTQTSHLHVHGGGHHPGKIVNRVYGLRRLLSEIAASFSGHHDLALAPLEAALKETLEYRFLDGSDADRTILLHRLGIDQLEQALPYPTILNSLRHSPSETFIAQAMRLATSAERRYQLAATLMAMGHHERGLGMILAEGPPALFYTTEAREFLQGIAPSLGLDAWRAEGLRLEATGDLDGALFCLETARANFQTGHLIASKISAYRAALAS